MKILNLFKVTTWTLLFALLTSCGWTTVKGSPARVIAETEKISSGKCKPLAPTLLDYAQAYQKPPPEVGTETPLVLVPKPLSSSQQKDKIIISLTQYGILLNAVIADCIDELKAKDQYAARLREELK